MPQAKCYLKNILVPDWTFVLPKHWQAIYETIQEPGWYGKEGSRYGFVSVIREGPMIGAYFAHEGLKQGIQYDDEKNPRKPSNAFFFEHLFFVIFLDHGQLLLQQKNVYEFVDLSLDTMRRQLFKTLANIFRAAGIRVSTPAIQVEDAQRTFTQTELYEFFMAHRPTTLEISQLKGAKVPEDIGLFNPEEDWDPIARAAIDKTLEAGLDHAVLEGDESDEQIDLKHGPVVKGLAAAGEIQKVTARDDRGRLIYREKNQKAELVLDLPLAPKVISELLHAIFDRMDRLGREELTIERKLANGTLPLFVGLEKEPESQKGGRIASLQRRIEKYQWNLNISEEKRANYGINVPLELENEIKAVREKLMKAQRELDGLQTDDQAEENIERE